jgi:hypothetical protein
MTMVEPLTREVLVDARGDALRATWHADERTVQLSMWRDGLCRATFPLSTDDAARLSMFLTASLAGAVRDTTTPPVAPVPRWRAQLARWTRRRAR